VGGSAAGTTAVLATAYAPGSTSNLGPGFDCLGVAFTGKGDWVTATVTEVSAGAARVRVASVSDPRIPLDPARNTAAIAAASVLSRVAASSVGLELSIEKGLPLSGGMGGSAASAVAGAVVADAVLGAGLSRERLLEAALEAESVVAGRHLDNVAPSLYGGAVLVVSQEPGSQEPAHIARLRVHSSLGLVLATPAYEVETARARAVLPAGVPRGDAIGQASCLAALVIGLERGDYELVRASMQDRIAEPARASLYPGYPEARAAALAAGALGVVVSGAGPTVVAVVPLDRSPQVAEALVAGYRRVGLEAVAHEARVDEEGARVVA
jgi:homoserine kinase